MTTAQVGKQLVELCKAGEFHKAAADLYADDIVSVEAMAMPGQPQTLRGKKAVMEKGTEWSKTHQVHSCTVGGPFPHGEQFIVTFDMDVTALAGPMKGQRMRMNEAGLYTVKDGKVVHESFFYSGGPE